MKESRDSLPLCKICGNRHRGVKHDFKKKPKAKKTASQRRG